MAPPPALPSYTKIWHTEPYPSISLTRPELSAHGKVILVTGGGTGIGAAVAKSFAQAGAAAIGLIGRREHLLASSAAAISSLHPDTKVDYVAADLTDKNATISAFKQLSSSLGKIDVFVSNAGFLSKPSPLLESDDDDWWRGFEINVKGSFNAIKAFLPVAGPNPVLLSINTGVATLPTIKGFSSYAASKIASAKLHEYLSVECPDVHVVNVHPGVVETDMSVKSGFSGPKDSSDLTGAFVVWLASPEAKFLKGKFAWINWDVDELIARAKEIEEPEQLELILEPSFQRHLPIVSKHHNSRHQNPKFVFDGNSEQERLLFVMARKRKAQEAQEEEKEQEEQDKNPASSGTRQADGEKESQPPTKHGFDLYPVSKVYRLIEPGPVLLVTTGSLADGTHNIMTIGFHMVMQHESPPLIGISLGPWDASFTTLKKQRECVLAIPSVEMANVVVDVGNCSADDDEISKWQRFKLDAFPAEKVRAPLVGGSHIIANIECVVEDTKMVSKYSMWVLKPVKAWVNQDKMPGEGGKMFHHRGDGTFVVDGDILDLKDRMVKWKEFQD
ncbi:hypothetical protein B7494_g8090 [Chlorociboria aeruginascens]|nr:hypothetical protein B7494_g8090 [Chlorociboria aeruginascens]